MILLSSIILDKVLPLLLFKMKNKNFFSKDFQQIGLGAKSSNPLIKGITKALLEKYKSKLPYDIETKSDRKNERILA